MKKNIGTVDRVIRGALALIFFACAWWASSWIALLIGLFCLYQALASWCVFYQLLGINTCPINRK